MGRDSQLAVYLPRREGKDWLSLGLGNTGQFGLASALWLWIDDSELLGCDERLEELSWGRLSTG